MSKFDFSKLKKFDIQGMVESVKSIINPEVPIPPGMENDPMAAKLTLLKTELQNLSVAMEQQQQAMTKMNTLVASLFKDLETLKKGIPAESGASTAATTAAEKSAAEREKEDN